MIQSRVFVFLAIALFLAGCLSAVAGALDGAGDANENSAKKAVAELQELTGIVLGHAEAKFGKAENTKSTVESQKDKAEGAELFAKTTAEGIKAEERKEEAAAVAQEAQRELATCLQLHQTAKEKADQVSDGLKEFVTRATELVKKANISIPADATQPNAYATVIQDAGAVTSDTQTLSGNINGSTLLSDEDDALVKLRDSAKKIEVFKYKVESIAIVAKIEAALKTAETDIQSIQEKKGEINSIVQAMNTECERAPDSLKISLRSLCTTANSQLQTATTKVQEAQQCNTDMQQRKTQLDTTFKALKDTTDEDTAKAEAANVEGHETFIDGKIEKITQALGAITNALSSANDAQGQLQNKMSQQSSQLATELNKGRQQDNLRTPEVTNPILNTGAQNTAIPKTDKTALGQSENTMDKASEQTIDANLDNTEQTKSTELTDKQKQNLTDDNSELLNNDQLRNITRDITNNPLIGREVPTRSAANDSAVTVFIPLLVILVISAVLH